MKEHGVIKFIFPASLIFLLYLIPILIFVKGFFLHRDVLPNTSKCTKDTFSTCFHSDVQGCLNHYNTSSSVQYCTSSHFKVILFFIDALRYDFIDFQEGLDPVPPYLNKLGVIRDLLNSHSNHTRLFKFIADPPSTTMQRIKGLTTGSLPTFIEIGSNFFSKEIDENNIIDVLNVESKTAVFLGDDTWMKLYPKKFLRQYPFDSFNVWDLDSVDRGVEEHLLSEVHKSDWNLLIAHFLGVDHCGHRYGPNHPEMARKLTEMNNVLRDLITNISSRDDVILFVIGDHGMTSSGNHGGETEKELTSALFVYSPKYPLYFDTRRSTWSVRQVDLVPTLSAIVGTAIPFSNTGRIILDCLPEPFTRYSGNITFILWQSVQQLISYIKEYGSLSNQFKNIPAIEEIQNRYEKLKQIRFSGNDNLEEFIKHYDVFTTDIVDMFRKAWIQFNFWYIGLGNVMMVSAILVNVSILFLLKISELKVVWYRMQNAAIIVVISILCLVSCLFFIPDLVIISAAVIIELYSISKLLQFSIPFLKHNLNQRLSSLFRNLKIVNVLAFIITICSFVGLFSNSFILEEASLCYYLLISAVCVIFLSHLRFLDSCKDRSILLTFRRLSDQPGSAYCVLIIFCMKLVSYFVKCREEKDYCRYESDNKQIWKFITLLFLPILCNLRLHVKKTVARKFKVISFLRVFCTFILFVVWGNDIVFGSDHGYSFLESVPAIILSSALLMNCINLVFFARHPNNVGFLKIPLISQWCVSINIPLFHFLSFLAIIFSIIAGPAGTVPVVSLFIYLSCLAMLLKSNSIGFECMVWSNSVVWGLSATFWFYANGQNALFSSIQWDAAFIFQKDIGSSMMIPSILVTAGTFCSHIIHGVLFQSLLMPDVSQSLQSVKHQENVYFYSFLQTLQYVTFLAIRVLGIMLCCTLHSRHLMIWMIFAPKFIFEALSFIISSVSMIFVGFILFFRLKN